MRDLSKQNFEKKIYETNFIGKNILSSNIFDNCFSENEIFESWSMAVGVWLFFGQLQMPMTRMCSTQTKHLIPLNDIAHQELWTEI